MQGKTRSHDGDILANSELILNPDGSVYHLGIRPEHLSERVVIVGDPERVGEIASRFSSIEFDFQNREFRTCKGLYNGVELTVVSTGIGVDNIDIVINELDAAANIDLESRQVKSELKSLKILRLGTSGSLRADIPVGSMVYSAFAFGLDGVPYTYVPTTTSDELDLQNAMMRDLDWPDYLPTPYVAKADQELLEAVGSDMVKGITMTANGFYGPQGRSLRLSLRDAGFHDKLRSIEWNGLNVTNIEMECAGLYSLGGMLGHQMGTACVILANRESGAFSKEPQKHINELIDKALSRLTQTA
jgi:uridine phosphorylase